MDPSHKVDGYPGIKLKARTGDITGIVWLSSVLGSPKFESEVEFTKKVVARFSCPNCSAELTSTQTCDMCGALMARFKLSDGGKVRVCCRSGCKNVWLEL
jgi:hypothetical protein